MKNFVHVMLAFAVPVVACSGGPRVSDPELVGVARANLAQVPSGVGCVRIVAAGFITVTDSFDVMPGQTSVLSLSKLPTGNVTFSGSAFNSACASVTDPSSASWLASPVATTITPGVTGSITLTFDVNGSETVCANFDDGTDAGGCVAATPDSGIDGSAVPTWHAMTMPIAPNAVGGTGAADVWFAGSGNQLIHWNGAALSVATSTVATGVNNLALWTTAPNDVWVSSGSAGSAGGDVEHLSPSSNTWSVSTSGRPVFTSVWAIGSDVWAAGSSESSVLHSTDGGASWNTVALPLSGAGATWSGEAIWGSASNDVWIVGPQGRMHWNGALITLANRGTSSRAISGTSATDVWDVGPQGISHYDGTQWGGSVFGLPGVAIHASSASDVWAANGTNATLAHWDGTAWTTVPIPGATMAASVVWASSPTDVWAGGVVGSTGVVYHLAP